MEKINKALATVHIIGFTPAQGVRALCGFSNVPPIQWPPEHLWLDPAADFFSSFFEQVNCKRCLERYKLGDALRSLSADMANPFPGAVHLRSNIATAGRQNLKSLLSFLRSSNLVLSTTLNIFGFMISWELPFHIDITVGIWTLACQFNWICQKCGATHGYDSDYATCTRATIAPKTYRPLPRPVMEPPTRK